MKIGIFGRTFRVDGYTALWALALLTVAFLWLQWFVDKNYIGIVEKRSHFLGPQEPGRIQALLVEVGEPVRRDQVLAVLDVSDLTATLDHLRSEAAGFRSLERALGGRAAVEVQRLRLQLENEASELLDRVATLESQGTELAGLNAQISRLQEAEKAGLGTSRDLPALVIQRDALEAYLARQRGELPRLAEDARTLRNARRRLARADLDSLGRSELLERMAHAEELRREIVLAENRIRLRTLVSPCEGVVTDLNARPGDVVQDFDSVITVEERSPGYLTVYLPEKAELAPEPGMRAKIFSSRGRGHNAGGTVTFVHPGFTRAPERLSFRGQIFWARKVRVRLDSANTLIPGEVVNVRLEKNRRRHPAGAASPLPAGGGPREPAPRDGPAGAPPEDP
jgi:multidrug resistance efflux pump